MRTDLITDRMLKLDSEVRDLDWVQLLVQLDVDGEKIASYV